MHTVQVGSAHGRFNIEVSATGDVTSQNTAAATGGVNVLTFNTTPVVIDAAAFGENSVGDWTVLEVNNVRTLGVSTPVTLDLVPGLGYQLWIAATRQGRFFFDVAANGDVASQNTAAAAGGVNLLTFNTTTINVDPMAFAGTWFLLGVTGNLSGQQAVTIVPGVSYLTGVGGEQIIFSVAEPCAVDPPQLVFTGATLALSCGALDGDEDGVPDDTDNCPAIANPDQVDQDLDGLGNLCDADLDGDFVDNGLDNCPDIANTMQDDLDGDGIGDACDTDTDGDAVPDNVDNCPLVPNTGQGDNDGDLLGDACDDDDDDDLVLDVEDNCPLTFNPFQSDFDGDGDGDACDGDTDGDTVVNELDLCPGSPSDLVDLDGCTGAQFISLTCDRDNFVQHGQYVSCVAHAANGAVDEGLLSPKQKARFVREAAKKPAP